ncbi:hypothetical protein [Fodinibius sp. Rm-B-1B1-1]|uniref:hypothetical protein n=1 Tax=Fodinibius alkaliphilus TaxID=3140241 RepID=UPI00315ABEEB
MKEINSEELEDNLEKLLNPDRSSYELHPQLKIAQNFMHYCSNSIYPNKIIINDELGLLRRFEEVFYAIQSIVEIFSKELNERISDIESKLNLSQNIVRLGMMRESLSPTRFVLFRKIQSQDIELQIPESGYKKLNSQLLLDLKTALERLAGMCGAASREAKKWWLTNEDVFVIEDFYDPRHISKNYLKILVGKIKSSLNEDEQIPAGVVKKLTTELDNVVDELESDKTSWNKVFSTLSQTVIVLAAVVTIAANCDEALQNAKTAFEYISSKSVSVPKVSENGLNNIPKLSGIDEKHGNKPSDQEE